MPLYIFHFPPLFSFLEGGESEHVWHPAEVIEALCAELGVVEADLFDPPPDFLRTVIAFLGEPRATTRSCRIFSGARRTGVVSIEGGKRRRRCPFSARRFVADSAHPRVAVYNSTVAATMAPASRGSYGSQLRRARSHCPKQRGAHDAQPPPPVRGARTQCE
jgi:hypothetical protein